MLYDSITIAVWGTNAVLYYASSMQAYHHFMTQIHVKIIHAGIIRKPDIVVGRLRFYRDSFFFLSSFFVTYAPSSLNETQPKPTYAGK